MVLASLVATHAKGSWMRFAPGRPYGGLGLALLGLLATPASAAPEPPPPYTNRLIASADPYLRLHAHNPVDWYPWGAEAFAKAKAENKPIFLSIGYSTCFWCHVAEKTIYADPQIAALMNRWFVNVKVDREQRPDVDRLYIIASQMLTEHGAWPNNLFLTPDGKPFYAGSYFPPADDGDTPGFPRVLAALHDLWTNHRADKVEPAADEVMDGLRAIEARRGAAADAPVTPRAWLADAARATVRSLDPVNGGLGSPASGPKFPQAPALGLLADAARLDGDAAAGHALAATLRAMALGGIDDQLAGGFHRYATEPTWSVPHFEKMLSDNAQLLALYTDAAARTKDPIDRMVATATARFLARDMALPDGGFATALDAETGGVEGATYLWTRAQVEGALGAADTERFLGVYELTPVPERQERSAPSPGVLRVRLPIADTLRRAGAGDIAAMLSALEPLRSKLLAARAARPQPARDDKAVASLNGQAIAALARAGTVLDAPELTAAAAKAATRLWTLAYADGALKHQVFEGRAEGDGYLEDYAMLGGGLLSLAEADGDPMWRERATILADAMLGRFLRPDGGLSASTGGDLLPVALDDGEDADAPSGTSAALDLLGRLGAAHGGARFGEAEARIAARLAGRVASRPTMWPSAVVALADFPRPSPPAQVAAAPARVASSEPAMPGVPSTADHVHAVAAVTPGPEGDTVAVTLSVDPGYHINAHVPSLDYLVPTDLAFAGAAPSSLAYPKASRFKPGFATTPLAVYEGRVPLVATLPKGASGWTATVTAQACDDQTCLPPATVPVSRAK